MAREPNRHGAGRLAVPVASALGENESLGRLMARVQESHRRLADVRTALPAGLAAQVSAGPLDETGWTLLARNGGAAAKLRQCLPLLGQRLRESGWQELPIRVKVHVAGKS